MIWYAFNSRFCVTDCESMRKVIPIFLCRAPPPPAPAPGTLLTTVHVLYLDIRTHFLTNSLHAPLNSTLKTQYMSGLMQLLKVGSRWLMTAVTTSYAVGWWTENWTRMSTHQYWMMMTRTCGNQQMMYAVMTIPTVRTAFEPIPTSGRNTDRVSSHSMVFWRIFVSFQHFRKPYFSANVKKLFKKS